MKTNLNEIKTHTQFVQCMHVETKLAPMPVCLLHAFYFHQIQWERDTRSSNRSISLRNHTPSNMKICFVFVFVWFQLVCSWFWVRDMCLVHFLVWLDGASSIHFNTFLLNGIRSNRLEVIELIVNLYVLSYFLGRRCKERQEEEGRRFSWIATRGTSAGQFPKWSTEVPRRRGNSIRMKHYLFERML